MSVTTPAGSSAASEADRFIYDPPGPVLAWGQNDGMLGDGESENSEVPVEVSGLAEAQALSGGWGQSLALLADGKLMAWGENEFGTVGDGSFKQRTKPVGVCALDVSECPDGPYLEEVTAVSAGRLPSLALLNNGTVAAWGGNLYGDLATDTERNPYPLPVCTTLESPCKPENYLQGVVEISAGADFSLARLSDGTVMAWGENTQGELGQGTTSGPETCGKEKEACSRTPRPVSGLGEVAAIDAGSFQAFALLKNGTVMAWGANEYGQLGDGSAKLSSVPVAVCAIGEGKSCKSKLGEVASISGGYIDSFALLKNGTVAAWGYNGEGALGDASTGGPDICKAEGIKYACGTAPGLVDGLSGVRALAQGEYAWGGLAELEDGRLITWGANHWGELGDGTVANSDAVVGVCAPFAYGPCPEGPFLHGQAAALASGSHDLLALPAVSGPTVGSLIPDAGPSSGGTRVAIVGGDLEGAKAVDFGGAPAREFEVRSDDEIVAYSPAGSGAVAVTVTTPQGTSGTEPQDEFTYEGAPAVVTEAATHVEADAATLNASVDPSGHAVSECSFEYGISPSYGTSVPCSSLPGSGTKYVAVSANVTGLARGSTYYFRAVATSGEGTAYGAQTTFTTTQFPELGRCVKASHARYTSKSCTALSAGGDSGKYEWEPWPLANTHFTLSLGKLPLEAAPAKNGGSGSVRFECDAGSASGEYTGSQSATMSLVLTGCHINFFGSIPCNSSGAGAGEVDVQALPAQLGLIEAGPKPSVGWALGSPTGSTFATFECGGEPVSLAGSVIGASTADKMSQAAKLTYKGSEGLQTPERFEGGLRDTLTFHEVPSGAGTAVSLDTSGTIDSSEKVELRAME